MLFFSNLIAIFINPDLIIFRNIYNEVLLCSDDSNGVIRTFASVTGIGSAIARPCNCTRQVPLYFNSTCNH